MSGGTGSLPSRSKTVRQLANAADFEVPDSGKQPFQLLLLAQYYAGAHTWFAGCSYGNTG